MAAAMQRMADASAAAQRAHREVETILGLDSMSDQEAKLALFSFWEENVETVVSDDGVEITYVVSADAGRLIGVEFDALKDFGESFLDLPQGSLDGKLISSRQVKARQASRSDRATARNGGLRKSRR